MHYLFFVEQSYSFAILSPLAEAARARGGQVSWYVLPSLSLPEDMQGEHVVRLLAEARSIPSSAVIAPGNWVPSGLSGLAVQVFHGFAFEKKGHFRIRGFFDLYCTPGPFLTQWFEEAAAEHGYFGVVETGWPKLDPIAANGLTKRAPTEALRLLYAPTFSPSLTSAPELLDIWKGHLTRTPDHLTIRFHPLMDRAMIDQYRALEPLGAMFDTSASSNQAIRDADIVISDTSSIVQEACWQGRPVITVRNSAPNSRITDIATADDLPKALVRVANNYEDYVTHAKEAAAEVHPYWDGASSQRVLDAIDAELGGPGRGKRPGNYLRRWKVGRKVRKLERAWRKNV